MITVSNDAFEMWKDNEVTHRFMEEMRIALNEAVNERIFGTHENMIKAAHERNEAINIFESVLEWKPQELEK
jgi:hypothetical protein